jgi:hypothetical protein
MQILLVPLRFGVGSVFSFAGGSGDRDLQPGPFDHDFDLSPSVYADGIEQSFRIAPGEQQVH